MFALLRNINALIGKHTFAAFDIGIDAALLQYSLSEGCLSILIESQGQTPLLLNDFESNRHRWFAAEGVLHDVDYDILPFPRKIVYK